MKLIVLILLTALSAFSATTRVPVIADVTTGSNVGPHQFFWRNLHADAPLTVTTNADGSVTYSLTGSVGQPPSATLSNLSITASNNAAYVARMDAADSTNAAQTVSIAAKAETNAPSLFNAWFPDPAKPLYFGANQNTYQTESNGFFLTFVSNRLVMAVNRTNGNVGIGTNGPGVLFDVVAKDNTTTDILQVHAQNMSQGIGINYGTISKLGTGVLAINDAFGNVTLQNLVNISTTSVGIGTTTPGYKLHVAGDTYLPSNAAPWIVTSSTLAVITNINARATLFVQLAFDDAVAAMPSCTVVATNMISTNNFGTLSPVSLGVNGSVTNHYSYPLQTNAVLVITDTSTAGAAVRVLNTMRFN